MLHTPPNVLLQVLGDDLVVEVLHSCGVMGQVWGDDNVGLGEHMRQPLSVMQCMQLRFLVICDVLEVIDASSEHHPIHCCSNLRIVAAIMSQLQPWNA